MSGAMIDLAEAEALPADRWRAAVAAALLLAFGAFAAPFVSVPLGPSFSIFAITISLSIAAVAVTSLLLWAQAGVTRSVPLAVLALGYELTALAMIPYMLVYKGLWPQLAALVSADAQSTAWLWVLWHSLFIGSALAYYRTRASTPANLDAAGYARLQRRLFCTGGAILIVTVPPLIWVDGLPALSNNGQVTWLFSTAIGLLILGALVAIGLAYRTSRLRSILDLWLAFACLSMIVDVSLQRFSHQFTAGWYASRVGVVVAASTVLFVLLWQTAHVYAELAVTAERLRDESLTDALTGLANRRSFDQRFVEALRDCARTKRPIALLVIDVDHFKLFNDAFGHAAGDVCLHQIGGILLDSASRARDVVARIGGEELAVIMPEVDLPGALIVAERMRAAVRAAAIPQGPGAAHRFVTVSIGVIATRDPGHASIEELFRAADRALYLAKDTGRTASSKGAPNASSRACPTFRRQGAATR